LDGTVVGKPVHLYVLPDNHELYRGIRSCY